MIKRILVPLDGSEFAASATRQACRIAKHCAAEVLGLAILDIAGINDSLTSAAVLHTATPKNYRKLLDKAQDDGTARIRQMIDQFSEVCEQAQVQYSEHQEQGLPSNRIVEVAAGVDLVIMGLQTHFRYPVGDQKGRSLVEVLDHSAVPTLAVPKHLERLPRTALLAFDGSQQATRAMRMLATLNAVHPFEQSYVVTTDQDPQDRKFLLEQAAAYLRSHQLTNLSLEGSDRDIMDIVSQDYLDKVDLIALGVHSKHGLKDFFVGSLAKSLIDYGHLPLLLAQ